MIDYALLTLLATFAQATPQRLTRVFGVSQTLDAGLTVLLGLVAAIALFLVVGLSYLKIPTVFRLLVDRFSSAEFQEIYRTVVRPYQDWVIWTVLLTVADLSILIVVNRYGLPLLEFPLGLLVAISIIFLGFALFKTLFDNYLLEVALEDQTKINSELLVLAKFISNAVIVLIVIFLFAETHRINVFGLTASLGVGSVAIAFASQKVLEQILWSITLYIDRPFVVGDYIHLPDRTLGRVESIGWRSTKVRLSGKNTLVIIPNSNLAQTSIENLTRARRVISIVELTFFRVIPDEERALVQQLIIGSTRDILGIDHRLTQVTFEEVIMSKGITQAQIVFFILGAAENSMELRKSLLEIAQENIVERLHEYGIAFRLEEKTTDISQPMNIDAS
ncbi:Low conductance mechanosensitive channel YnaI [Acaryochloris thomasi RCC1774]|uniref:Low conductance mechanosensitive channel YnaI n=1 Tax=Acaryochloris thomasi RCC1774 TaxID=1764569 RepID=A0A2W1JP69_9CYAN|nr:mechanosensitive ion channel domain-containing protein [Acaryochloris thomasi]PZD75113.1 Low conductance mechanosensitive channel YnaI [Acaryochloris thomasi RCC1774]